MKKRILTLMGIMGLVFLIGCSAKVQDNTGKGLEEYKALPTDHLIQSVDFNAAKALIESGTGALILSFPDCPWCQSAMPVLNEVAKELKLKNLYYLNVRELSKEEENNEYAQLKDLLRDFLTIEDGESVLYVPDVYAIKDGEILGHHLGTTDSHDAYEREMNEEEIKELKEIYRTLFASLK